MSYVILARADALHGLSMTVQSPLCFQDSRSNWNSEAELEASFERLTSPGLLLNHVKGLISNLIGRDRISAFFMLSS